MARGLLARLPVVQPPASRIELAGMLVSRSALSADGLGPRIMLWLPAINEYLTKPPAGADPQCAVGQNP